MICASSHSLGKYWILSIALNAIISYYYCIAILLLYILLYYHTIFLAIYLIIKCLFSSVNTFSVNHLFY